MKKKLFIISFIIILIILIISFYLYLPINKNNRLIIDSYFKNNTWQIGLTKNVPYKIGDEVEFINIIKGGDYIANLDISNLKQEMNILSITLNGKNIGMNDLGKIKIISDEPSLLNIKGKAIRNKTQNINLINIKNEVALAETKKIKEKIIKYKTKAKNISFATNSFNSNLNNLLEINGDNLESIKYVLIGEKSFNPILDGGKIYIQIDKNTFSSGDYFVMFQLSNGEIITKDTKLNFEYSNNKINIGNITPSKIINNTDRIVVLQGNGFNKLLSMQLSNNLIFKNTEFTIINDNVVTVKIPKGIEPGIYHLNLMDTIGIYESKGLFLIINN